MDFWPLPRIDLATCTNCGNCVDGCPTGALEKTPSGPTFAQPYDCTFCADCETFCPVGAIRCEFEVGGPSPDPLP